MGRPKISNQKVKDRVIGFVEIYPELKLRDIKSLFDLSTTNKRTILNKDSYC